jgi:hypothetical protein
MYVKNDPADPEVTAGASSFAGPSEGSDQHELLVAAAQAVLSTLRVPIAQQALPRPALGALRMLAAVLANGRSAKG